MRQHGLLLLPPLVAIALMIALARTPDGGALVPAGLLDPSDGGAPEPVPERTGAPAMVTSAAAQSTPSAGAAGRAGAASSEAGGALGRMLRGVVRGVDGDPVARARVRLHDGLPAPREAESDAAGRFTLDDLAAWPLDVEVEADGHVPRRIRVLEERDWLEVLLDPGGGLRARVTDPEGIPVQAALVTFHHAHGCGSALTDPEGWAALAGLPLGVGSLRVEKAGWNPLTEKGVLVEPDAPAEHHLTTRPVAPLRGRVVHAPSGRPVARARLSAVAAGAPRRIDAQATTDLGGRFVLAHGGSPSGLLRVEVEHDYLGPSTHLVALDDGSGKEPVLRVRSASGAGVRDPLPAADGRIEGLVRDADGSPLGGATVRLVGGGPYVEPTTTSIEGRFGFEGLRLGTYDLLVFRDPAQPELGRSLVLGEEPMDPLVLQMPAHARLGGRVLDARGLPAVGAILVARPRAGDSEGLRRRGTTGAGGRFELRVPEGLGPWRIEASGQGRGNALLEAVAAGREDVVLHLDPEAPAPQP